VDDINDDSNDCASTMFSYINLYGKYPPGLFASECKGDKKGLACPDASQKDIALQMVATELKVVHLLWLLSYAD
jgi:hypothetical protein